MLKYRLIFGPLFAAILVGFFWLDTVLAANWPDAPWSAPRGTLIAALCLALVPVALAEFRRLLAASNIAISMRICIVSCLLCIVWPWIEMVSDDVNKRVANHEVLNTAWVRVARAIATVKPHYLVPTVLAIAILGAFLYHTRQQQTKGAMANAGGTLLAIVYLGVLPSFFLPICLTYSAWMVLGIIAIVKAADIGAYTAGHLFGRHKLIPWLSPGKTREGFFGGLLFAGLAAVVVAALTHLSLWQGALFGVILGAIGQVGDLVESLLKRDAGVKDSGQIPGFGGVLDLLDSPLLAAPAAYWLLKIVSKA